MGDLACEVLSARVVVDNVEHGRQDVNAVVLTTVYRPFLGEPQCGDDVVFQVWSHRARQVYQEADQGSVALDSVSPETWFWVTGGDAELQVPLFVVGDDVEDVPRDADAR